MALASPIKDCTITYLASKFAALLSFTHIADWKAAAISVIGYATDLAVDYYDISIICDTQKNMTKYPLQIVEKHVSRFSFASKTHVTSKYVLANMIWCHIIK